MFQREEKEASKAVAFKGYTILKMGSEVNPIIYKKESKSEKKQKKKRRHYLAEGERKEMQRGRETKSVRQMKREREREGCDEKRGGGWGCLSEKVR